MSLHPSRLGSTTTVYYPFRPQSGHIRPCGISPIRPYPPGKTAVFPKFSTFFQIRTSKKVLTAHRGPIYQIKASKIPSKTQRKLSRFDKYMCVGETLNMVSCFIFWRNIEGIWGNPGEIPQFGWQIRGVYRVMYAMLLMLNGSVEAIPSCNAYPSFVS